MRRKRRSRETIRRRLLRLAAASVVAMAAWLVGASQAVGAESEGGEESTANERQQLPVAVLSFDDGADSGALMETVSDVLNRSRYDVVAGKRLADRLAAHQAGPVSEEVASEFAGIADDIGDGVRSFFYKGNETAVDELTPIFDLGMGHPEVLVRRPDFAEQIFQAGIVLVRSHRNLGNDDRARTVARQLVRKMPGREPSPSTAPPGTIRLFRDQREKLADSGTKIGARPVDSDECTAYLNGTRVGKSLFVAAPGEDYFFRLECGRSGGRVWRASPDKGEHLTVPISSRSPLDYVLEEADFTGRKRGEAFLRLVQYWTDLPRVLGVKSKSSGGSDDGVLVVWLDSTGEAVWSDTMKRGKIRRVLARVMPEYEATGPPADGSAPADAGGGRGLWLDWTLLAGGGALLGGAAAGTAVTERRAQQIRCSPDTVASPGDCSGIPTLRLGSAEAIQRAEDEVNLARAGYIAGYAVGAGLAGWGIWRLVSRGPGGAAAGAMVLPTRTGWSAQLQIRW